MLKISMAKKVVTLYNFTDIGYKDDDENDENGYYDYSIVVGVYYDMHYTTGLYNDFYDDYCHGYDEDDDSDDDDYD